MVAVYLETNGMSTVSDPSGTVLVDVPPPVPPPPVPPPTAPQPPALPPVVAERIRVQALLDAAQTRNAALPGAPVISDGMVTDLLHQWAKKPQEHPDLHAWAALDV